MEDKKILNGGFVNTEGLETLHKSERILPLNSEETKEFLKSIDLSNYVIGIDLAKKEEK
ncbi:hypothetical protein [Metabacillus sp. Hm71]|uniref:hypothetical protein n=1 Tax=Metabacillus sp. Hm71 TaxID=3450743 RepID=UPI003F440883